MSRWGTFRAPFNAADAEIADNLNGKLNLNFTSILIFRSLKRWV
jgi:hypothetical protein